MANLVKQIGIDIDTHSKRINSFVETRIQRHYLSKSYTKKKTKHGFHYKVTLKRKITVFDSFLVRYYMLDDKHRLLKDFIRWVKFHDIRLIDTLFDHKTYINEEVTLF